MPGAPGTPTLGMGIALAGSSAPHFGQTVSAGAHVSPHSGHFLSAETAAGLKHIGMLLSRICENTIVDVKRDARHGKILATCT